MFRHENIRGNLMFIAPDEKTGYKFTVWFDYTRKLVNEVREGDFVAIPNFGSTPQEKRWSIVEITSVMPTHYALGSSRSDLAGYPGYIMEAAGNLPVDWIEQESESHEDTTKIICEAIPVNLGIVERQGAADDSIPIVGERSLPMTGAEAKLLSTPMTQRVVNLQINPRLDDIITVGTLTTEPSINIFMRVEDAIKTHIGMFGFTGVGKSNFISTVLSSILNRNADPTKIMIFDLNSEYNALLMDHLLDLNLNACIVCLGDRTLPGPVLQYLNEPKRFDLGQAVSAYLRDLYLPRSLRAHRDSFRARTENLLRNSRIRVLDERLSVTVGQFFTFIHDEVFDEYAKGSLRVRLEQFMSELKEGRENEELSPQLASEMLADLAKSAGETSVDSHEMVASGDPFEKRLGVLAYRLEGVAGGGESQIQPNAGISMGKLITDFNTVGKSSLIIINSHDPNLVRRFANNFGYWTYEERRRRGLITPLALFVFDEADEFIPGQPPSPSHAESKKIIETLARRGRKFGLGVMIATQRSAYLDTNIMGQLHTYFISKLPRKYDRDVVGEAFSLSEEVFRQTFKFQKGDWLYISHEAAGLDATPIPIHAPNAEDRIKRWLGVA